MVELTVHNTHASRACEPWMGAGLLCVLFAGSLAAANSYVVHSLVSDIPGLADHFDKNLVNPWGNATSTASPFWLGNNHSGTSTLYDGTGTAVALVVNIPGPGGPMSPGAVTGVIWNSTPSFVLPAPNNRAASFMFCTEDGTILGWNSGTVATIMVDNSASHAIYKGCAQGGTATAPLIYAANFNSGKVDVFDGAFKPVMSATAFVDAKVAGGFAPFNVAVLGGKVYVTYAKQDNNKEDDVAGPGNGYVAVFDLNGGLLSHLIDKGALNSPWGLAIAPPTFGDFASKLLVANFGDGTIHAVDPNTGMVLGMLNNAEGTPIVIPGLWSLLVGNGGRGGDPSTIYFSAGIPGPNGEPVESHGLLGSIQPAPSFQASTVVNAASATAGLAANTFVTIKGGALAATTRSWQGGDFVGNKLPTQIDEVGVTVNGEPAYVSFVSPGQLNVLFPADLPQGPAKIQTYSNGLSSPAVNVTLGQAGPAFFMLPGNKYIAATHPDGSLTAGTVTGLTTSPAAPGEQITLFANGLGATSPAVPNGQLLAAPLKLAVTPTVTIGGSTAEVRFAGLVSPGLYQINVVVPTGLPPGDAAVVLTASGLQSQAGAFVSIAAQQ